MSNDMNPDISMISSAISEIERQIDTFHHRIVDCGDSLLPYEPLVIAAKEKLLELQGYVYVDKAEAMQISRLYADYAAAQDQHTEDMTRYRRTPPAEGQHDALPKSELKAIKDESHREVADLEMKKLVPAVRPRWYGKTGDNFQEQETYVGDAIRDGADLLVCSSPIRKSENRKEALVRTLDEMY